ncbi:hybrid signal transduction histidine kinase M [Tanacetum coccineum]
MGCLAGNMPFTYLGIPIGLNMKKADSWKVIMEKFKKRLGNWKTKMISYDGRLTLIKNKDITVGDKRVWRNDIWDWRWEWARELRGRGLGDFEELTVLTNFFVPNVLQEDSWKWIHDDNGAFMVKELRNMVDDKILNPTNGAQDTKWCKIIPRKVCIFIWHLQQRRLSVYTCLENLGIDLNSTLCPHCGNDIKTVDHCFLRCSRAIDTWVDGLVWYVDPVCSEDSMAFAVVTTPGNAKALCDHLKELFHDNKDARAINLDNELRSIKIGKMTVNEYCTKIRSMADRLINLGCVVSDKNLVIYTINGLDSRFATLVEIIRNRETFPSFENVRTMLLLKESSFNNDSGSSTDFSSSSSSPTVLLASNQSNNKAKVFSGLRLLSIRLRPLHYQVRSAL